MAKNNGTAAKSTKKAGNGKAASKKAERKQTIGEVAVASLRKNADAQEALAAVKKAFPKAKTTIGCIYWYASQNEIRLQRAAAAA